MQVPGTGIVGIVVEKPEAFQQRVKHRDSRGAWMNILVVLRPVAEVTDPRPVDEAAVAVLPRPADIEDELG